MSKLYKKQKKIDKILLVSFGALIAIGILALISASAQQSNNDFGNIYGYFMHQFIYGFIIGGALALVAYKFPYKKLEKLALPIFIISILFMLLVFVPGIGVKIGGSQRWIDLKFTTLQPSEIMKLGFIIYFSAWLSSHIKKVRDAKALFPFITLLGGLVLLLILQPDLSTIGILAVIAIVMYFTAGAKIREMIAISGLGIAAFYIFVKISPYRLRRITTFLNPEADPFGVGYQINQLFISVGSGQIWGTGPLQGTQKNYLPLAMNDSIFAVWAEETGFIGAGILILLFLVIAWRGFHITKTVKTHFAKFIAVGITTWLFVQAVVNMGAILGVVPLTGTTLPLISYGSSSLIVTLAAMGLLLQLSKETT